ncbi:hypothetical protein E4U55_004137 [Claviceps digitariae]|nr:hypothetical protein E4U55_004137 [Claviceps digitariae]
MKGVVVLGALAASAAAWKYPDCDSDNCYRALTKDGLKKEAESFCFSWLSGTTTAAAAIPGDFQNCDVRAASSACSCITYTATHTTGVATMTTEAPAKPTTTTMQKPTDTDCTDDYPPPPTKVTTTTAEKPTETDCTDDYPPPPPPTTRATTPNVEQPTTTPAQEQPHTTTLSISISTGGVPPTTQTDHLSVPTNAPTTAPLTTVVEKPTGHTSYVGQNTTRILTTKMTTSTVYTTKIHTITACPPQVTECPGRNHTTVVTETIPLYTTVCPVTEPNAVPTSALPHPPPPPPPQQSAGLSTYYTTHIYTITACPPYVPDCPIGKVTTTVYPTGPGAVPPPPPAQSNGPPPPPGLSTVTLAPGHPTAAPSSPGASNYPPPPPAQSSGTPPGESNYPSPPPPAQSSGASPPGESNYPPPPPPAQSSGASPPGESNYPPPPGQSNYPPPAQPTVFPTGGIPIGETPTNPPGTTPTGSNPPIVTAAAGHLTGRLELVAAVAGLAAILL